MFPVTHRSHLFVVVHLGLHVTVLPGVGRQLVSHNLFLAFCHRIRCGRPQTCCYATDQIRVSKLLLSGSLLVFHSRDFPFPNSRDPNNLFILVSPGNITAIPGNRFYNVNNCLFFAFPVFSIKCYEFDPGNYRELEFAFPHLRECQNGFPVETLLSSLCCCAIRIPRSLVCLCGRDI
jgi:hypothetical protein